MTVGIWQVEWLNANSQRAYPLVAEATRRDTTGVWELPNSLLLGITISVNADIDWRSSQFFIREIGSFPFGFYLQIAAVLAEQQRPLARAVVSYLQHHPPQSYMLHTERWTGFALPQVGRVIIGKIDDLQKQPQGVFRFEPEATRLEADCIHPMLPAVTSLQVISGGKVSPVMSGHIELVAGTNMRFDVTQQSWYSNRIRIHAISGEGLTEPCECGDLGPPIRSISGIRPTPDGDFFLTSNDCIELHNQENGIEIREKCAQPCCGCKETEIITSALETLRQQTSLLEQTVTQLEAQLTALDQIVLGSRFGDQGCIECQ